MADSFAWFKFFPTDWMADERLAMVSDAAMGVWIDMLCRMFQAEPRGVLPENPERLGKLLRNRPVDSLMRIIGELEREGVLSRGRNVDPELPADSYGNRRMYAEWKLSRTRAEAGRKGGLHTGESKARRGNQNAVEKRKPAQAKPKQNPSKTQAKPNGVTPCEIEGCADPPQAERKQTPGQRSGISICHMPEARNTTAVNRGRSGGARNGPTRTREKNTHPVAVGELIGGTGSGGFNNWREELLQRIRAVTGDSEVWMAWWSKAIRALATAGHPGILEEHLAYAEKCQNPATRAAQDLGKLDNPGGYLFDRVRKDARRQQVNLPAPPHGEQQS